MSITPPTLPTGYAYGFVTGQVIHAIGDQTGDADRYPQTRAATGSVTFTPLQRMKKVTSPPAFVVHEAVSCVLGPTGELIDPDGQMGVWLITGVYRVTFSLEGGATIPVFDITVTTAHTLVAPLDLVTVAPTLPPTGTAVTTLILPTGFFDGAVLGWQGGAPVWLSGGGGSGVEEVSGVVTLGSTGPRLRQFYTVGAATIGGEVFPIDTALVARRTAAGVWQVAVVDSADWRAFLVVPTVTATAPTFTDPSGTGSDTYTIPTKANVIYKVAGATKAAGTYPGSGTVTVTAEAAPGYVLTGTASWPHTFSTAIADTTPPTAGTLASSAITETGFTVTVSGASDAVALHATPYAFSTNNGTTWTTWQASAAYTASGLTASTGYQARHKVRDASGNESTGSAITVTTTASAPSITEDFAGDGALAGKTTTTGGLTWAADTADVMTNATSTVSPVPLPISGGEGYKTSNAAAAAILTLAQSEAEISVDYDLGAPTGGRVNLGLARASTGNRITAFVNSTETKIFQGVAGTLTQVAAKVAPNPSTGRFLLGFDGTTAYVTIDGTLVASGTVTATSLGTTAGVGLSGEAGRPTVKNLAVRYL